jgi:hypothetical protein
MCKPIIGLETNRRTPSQEDIVILRNAIIPMCLERINPAVKSEELPGKQRGESVLSAPACNDTIRI